MSPSLVPPIKYTGHTSRAQEVPGAVQGCRDKAVLVTVSHWGSTDSVAVLTVPIGRIENLFTIYTETAERSASTPPSDRHQSYEWDINVGNVYDAGAIITAKARGATGEIG
ncbi:hypothetical protein C8035_v006692 [Colletotrichum spinosum]|uniref:Uncharacterized protein n=1 Tax=Colletotrichum spinosum TaxID=1347390 RepID=A0A4R8PV39_9PEZI|nr:hypothetical protein C8035_v006692 [Colletotrichum spinosum]